MGKTIRNNTWHQHHKMAAYALVPRPVKYKAEKTDHVAGTDKGVSEYDKLITRNANRTFKKSVRQQAKREIREQLSSF